MKLLINSCAILLYCISLADCSSKRRNEICYQAKTCIHNAVEKCGVSSGGKYRRFLDSCDILEYNCLKGTDYTKTEKKNCKDLPSIDNQFVDEVQWPKDDKEKLNKEVAESLGDEESFKKYKATPVKLNTEAKSGEDENNVKETLNIEVAQEQGDEEKKSKAALVKLNQEVKDTEDTKYMEDAAKGVEEVKPEGDGENAGRSYSKYSGPVIKTLKKRKEVHKKRRV